MKKILFLFMLLSPLYASADAWDNLTYEQAESVQKFLNNTPFILDYCDCCDFEGEYAAKVYLMKVISTEIIACEWDNAFYSVKAKVEIIAELTYTENGPDVSKPLKVSREDELIITMNYTWSYSKEQAKVIPFFNIVPYDIYGENEQTSGSCRNYTDFPNPFKTNDVISDNEFRDWYKKNIGD